MRKSSYEEATQVFPRSHRARGAHGQRGRQLTAIADRSYFNGKEIPACHEAGITALVPKTKTSNARFDGRFDKADIIDDAEGNEYRCPVGRALIWRFSTVENGMTVRLDHNPDVMRLRRSSVEHPYGTINSWMGGAFSDEAAGQRKDRNESARTGL